MVTRQIKLEGPGVRGVVVKATLLRDLLALVIEGSQGAIRLRTQGRSVARGSLPAWIAKTSDFSVRILEGSTLLELQALTLSEARPEHFRQGDLFPEIDPDLTSFDYFADSVASAIEGERESSVFDKGLLTLLATFDGIFAQGVEAISLETSPHRRERAVRVRRPHLKLFEALHRKIPPPRRARIAGKLDSIRHSDNTFVLLLPTDQQIKGLAENVASAALKQFWGRSVVVSGTAFFTASGDVQRIEADLMDNASESDIDLWALAPAPLEADVSLGELRVPQGPRSGVNAIVGAWPGDESDDEIAVALQELS